MKEFIEKKCFIVVLMGYKVLFYNAMVLSVSDSHITFKDKFGVTSSFKIKDVIQISSEDHGGENFV